LVGIEILAHGLQKSEYYLSRKQYNYEISGIFVKNKTDYATCIKNAVNFLVAYIYTYNKFYEHFLCAFTSTGLLTL
jgi:HD superfamily phosphohydrolase